MHAVMCVLSSNAKSVFINSASTKTKLFKILLVHQNKYVPI